MTSRLDRFVGKLVKLRDGEGATALLMFAYSFLAMTAYNILKPITRSKFIAALGADNLPYVQLAAGLIIGVLMQVYSGAIGRLPRRWVIPVTQAGEVLLLVLFWVLFRTGADWVSVAFYVLGLVLGILLISQFWTLANDIYDPRQARRLFGFIGGGASLGGAMGAALTAFAVEEVGTNNLLLVSAAVLSVSVVVVTVIVKRQPITGDLAPVDERGVGGGEAIRLLRGSRHLQVIAMVIGFAALGAAIIDQQLNMAAEAIKGAAATDAITGFLAQVTFYLSIIGFVVQVALTSRIHRTLGMVFALLVLPVSLGTTATIILLNGALWAPAAARVIDTSLRYTLDKTTREVLFLPLPADLKFRAKPFVDVTADRFAKALGALLLLVLIKPWGLGLGWQRLSYASLVVTAAWIFMAALARREYLRAFRQSIEGRAVTPATVRLDVADPATIETLVEELASPDESAVSVRHRHARGARQTQSDHTAALAPRIPGRAGARARRARVGAALGGRTVDAGCRAHAEGRGRGRPRRGRSRVGGVAQGRRVHADAALPGRRGASCGRDGGRGAGRLGRRGRRATRPKLR